MDIRFDGKKALVTGAGKGIGRGIVKGLSKCGASVIALSRTQADLDSLQEEIPGLKTVCVDISDWEATRKAVSELGVVDILVNNAAIFRMAPFLETTKEHLDLLFDVNIKGVYNITQVIAQAMVDGGKEGVIINVSGILSQRVFPDTSAYCATKGALNMLTKALSIDLGKHKIRVAGVQPTITKSHAINPMFTERYLPRHTLGRFGEVEDAVNAILFALSDKASMLHGANLMIDGGFMAC